ncbi:unnamed protein product [Aphanomyces euteiches]
MSRHITAARYGFWERDIVRDASGAAAGYRRSVEASLYRELQKLLPTLMGARDYRAAGSVLSVIYSHFMTDPAACVTTSLEILRQLPDATPTLIEFYDTLLRWHSNDVSNDVILRERFLLYLLQGEFHEAYVYYKDHMQLDLLQQDVHVVASFGMLCFWLLFREDEDIRDQFIDPGSRNIGMSQIPIQQIVGVASLYQEALVSFRRAMTLCPESNIFVEYYIEILVMKNNFDQAADYLEHYYHLNPNEPHACRMLFTFFKLYYPESKPAQVEICLRWSKLDPAARVPLESLVEFFDLGLVSKDRLVVACCHALDQCGSDLYAGLNEWLWQHLAQLLGSVTQPSSTSMFESRSWWQRVYFSSTLRDLTLQHVHKCVVALHAFGSTLPFVTSVLLSISKSDNPQLHNEAQRFGLHSIPVASEQPPRKRIKITKTWSSPFSWLPSNGQTRMPHVMKRHQVLTSFNVHDALQVHEVDLESAPPLRLSEPPPTPIQIEDPHIHPLQWLLAKRGGRSSPWHAEMATVSVMEAQMDHAGKGNPILTEKDALAAVVEDEILLNPQTNSRHILTMYAYKKLPLQSSRYVRNVVRVMCKKYPLPEHRVPARILWWIQEYMMTRGITATPVGCRSFLEEKWRRVRGRCRGFPSIETLTSVMDYFKLNPAILPPHVRSLFRSYVLPTRMFTLRDLCYAFYQHLQERSPADLPFMSVLAATARQWLMEGVPLDLRAITCYPLHAPGDNIEIVNTVTEESFLTETNRRYLSSLRQWLLKESPIDDQTLVHYMHMHFDMTDPDFPTSSTLRAMINYVRLQLHAEMGEAPTQEDSIYFTISAHRRFRKSFRQYLKQHVVRHPTVTFMEAAMILLDRTKLPPFTDEVPSVDVLYQWWREAVDSLLGEGLGLGVAVQWQNKTPNVDIDVPKHLSKMPDLPPEMEIFPI